MIISRTPFRISFFGGGTDYPGWYNIKGGAVLAATINKYCYISCRHLPPFFEHRYRIVYSKIENCKSINEIIHPSVRAILTYLNYNRGVEIHHDGDLPARSGLGSSSAFTVGLLHALYALKGQIIDKKRLSEESIYVEQELLNETVGSQDQVSAAHGGLNHIVFPSVGKIEVKPIPLANSRIDELNSYLMLFYTGIRRTAADVADSYVNNIEKKNKQLCKLMDFVEEGISILTGGKDLSTFGHLLHETWQIKRTLSEKVTNAEVDELYGRARSTGALGGKLTGAGGGGFLLLFVPPSKQKKVRECLDHLIYVPIKIDFSGSQIIFFDPQEDYTKLEEEHNQKDIKKFRELTIGEK
jgi:D-glycero-alpha-D-manno-heptose-7-phosphate kinase